MKKSDSTIPTPPPRAPSTTSVSGTTMALLDEIILIYPHGQPPTQIDPHRRLMRSWDYSMPGSWGGWSSQFYFMADFHWYDQPAVRLSRTQAEDDPALHRPWDKKENTFLSTEVPAQVAQATVVEKLGECFCGGELELLQLPHPETGIMSMALSHGGLHCPKFMEDLPPQDFLEALFQHRMQRRSQN